MWIMKLASMHLEAGSNLFTWCLAQFLALPFFVLQCAFGGAGEHAHRPTFFLSTKASLSALNLLCNLMAIIMLMPPLRLP